MLLSKPEFLLLLCGILLIGLTAAGMTLPQPVMGQFGIGYGAALNHFVILGCVQGLIYFAAVALILHSGPSARALWMVLACAALLRLIVVVFPPFLSNDMYRYIWDGWVQAAGINPYRYIPADAHLAFLRDAAIFPNINRANYAHTIYPPAAQMIFFITSSMAKLLAIPPVLAMKLTMLAFEAIGIWAMIRLLDYAGLPRARILIYAWNPLPVWEFAGSGHVDAVAICFIFAVASNPIVNDFLTSPYAWFLLTNIKGLAYMERVAFETDMQVEFTTDNLLVKGYERYSFGYFNPRSAYGSFPTS